MNKYLKIALVVIGYLLLVFAIIILALKYSGLTIHLPRDEQAYEQKAHELKVIPPPNGENNKG